MQGAAIQCSNYAPQQQRSPRKLRLLLGFRPSDYSNPSIYKLNSFPKHRCYGKSSKQKLISLYLHCERFHLAQDVKNFSLDIQSSPKYTHSTE
jgi:hypothetical protein